MVTIGITGGIGTGKSEVIKILSQFGATIVDADKVAHSVYEPGGSAYDDVVRAFGKEVLTPDGKIDRLKLGPIVFADSERLKRLTDIVWPRTFARMREMVAEYRTKGVRTPIVVEAAVLIEANWQPLCDEIWLVTAPRDRVIERVAFQRGLEPEQAEARIRAQLSDDERRKYASIVIDNSGTVGQLLAKLKELWAEALKRNG